MRLHTFVIGLFLLAPVFAFSGISGTYRVSGIQPGATYGGTVVIERYNTVYKATWTDDDGEIERGTGVRKGDTISFVFKKGNMEAYGVQMYKISKHYLQGPWAWYGETWNGFEKLRKIK